MEDYKCICGLDEEHTADCAVYNSGRKAGTKEVTEWIDNNLGDYAGYDFESVSFEKDWQAFRERKLKEIRNAS